MKILIINGPNMNMLGIREPGIYGSESYDDLVEYIKKERGTGNDLRFVQTNHEGVIIDEIHKAYFDGCDGVVINPAGYGHTSIAIMDAMKAVPLPFVEVHISEPAEREGYRHHTYTGEAAAATVAGRGFAGYIEAIDIIGEYITSGL